MIITSQVKKFLYELCIESIKSFEDTELVYTISELIEYIEQTINILYKLNFEKSIGHYHKHYLFQIIHQIIYECKEKEWFCKLNSFQWKLDYEEFKFNFKPESINYKKQMVDSLNKEPKQRQGSEEWFQFRKSCLTASNITSIINNKNITSILLDKCGYPRKFVGGAAILHGKKYEDVAVLIYEHRTGRKVYSDYGCIRHKEFNFIGASPDGIDVEGNVIEIKCVYSRQLTGLPKQDYYDQMQLQMEVFQLSKCLFVECEIKEYTNFKEYKQDVFIDENGNNIEHKTINGKEKGVIFRIITKNTKEPLRYCYPENLLMTHKEIKEWVSLQKKQLKLNDPNKETYKDYDALYWKLTDFSCIEIYKDTNWISRNLLTLYNFWNRVKYYRNNNTELQLFKKNNSYKKKEYKSKTQILIENNYLLDDSEEEL